MRLSAVATVGIVLGLSLILSSCGGGDGAAAGGQASTPSTAGPPSAVENAGPPARLPRPCRELGPFVAALATLRDDLARGLSYDDYLTRVRGTRAVYAKLQPKRVSVGCLVAGGGPAERAFNLYIAAANAWGDCLATVTCNTRSVEPRLQRKWALAERRLALAKRAVDPAQ